MLKSVYHNEGELLKAMFGFYSKGIDLDLTFSTGRFYGYLDEEWYPKRRNDIDPKFADLTDTFDCQNVSDFAENLGSIVFDPPFLATKGPSLVKNDESNLIAKRFSIFSDEKELFEVYRNTINGCFKALKPGGRLFFKCQDKVSSGKQYFSHCLIYNMAIEAGFYPKDLFVLVSKSRMVPNKHKKQVHARKFHSYWWVLEKPTKV